MPKLPKMSSKMPFGLGVFSDKEQIYLFYSLPKDDNAVIHVDSSADGVNFKKHYQDILIRNGHGKPEENKNNLSFRISKLDNRYFLTYKTLEKNQIDLYGALSKSLSHWEKIGKIAHVEEIGIIVPEYKQNNEYVLYYGEGSIKIALSKDLKDWETSHRVVLEPRHNFFDRLPLKPAGIFLTDEGIFLIYYVYNNKNNVSRYSLGAALFDKNEPSKLLWRADRPIWEENEEWTKEGALPLGVVQLNGKLMSYWEILEENKIFAVTHQQINGFVHNFQKNHHSSFVEKFRENPIIKPIVDHFWESKATFNSAAVYEEGKVHFIYRAVGHSDTSVLGYASSSDGVSINERLDEPAYIPTEAFELNGHPYAAVKYMSGGGYGGCEDPRITKIDDTFYMTYVAFDGWNPPGIALTSIKVNDFLKKRWNWKKPVLISRPGIVDKNAVLFPEKVNGKYVIFHRVFPHILVDYVDDLNFDGKTFLKGEFKISPRQDYWDSRKVGAGPPPIKTKDGWLLIYQAVGDQDSSRYKIGAMLLDLNDPTKVLYRTNTPIIEPEEHYENNGHKFGVVYSCGATVINDELFVYYGGADMYTCAAKVNLNQFLNQMKQSETAILKSTNLHRQDTLN